MDVREEGDGQLASSHGRGDSHLKSTARPRADRTTGLPERTGVGALTVSAAQIESLMMRCRPGRGSSTGGGIRASSELGGEQR